MTNEKRSMDRCGPANRSRRLAVVVAAVAVALLGVPFPAAGAPAPGPYAALGDSYSSGVGTGSASGACGQSAKAYPKLWNATNRPSEFAFLACSGSTIDEVAGQVSGVPQSSTLVTLTAGGNDAGFATVISTCLSGTDKACNAAVAAGKTVATSAAFRQNFVELFAAINERAPSSTIVVLGYPQLFEETSACFAVAPGKSRRVNINSGARVLNDAIAAAVADGANADRSVRFVSVDARFANHRVCSFSPWIKGATLPASESFHPNANGHAKAYLPALTSVTKTLNLSPASAA